MRKPVIAFSIASTWVTPSAMAARSALRRPSWSSSAAAKAATSASSALTAAPWSRTILRKKKSSDWIAVVPSYRESIFASLMYCSIG